MTTAAENLKLYESQIAARTRALAAFVDGLGAELGAARAELKRALDAFADRCRAHAGDALSDVLAFARTAADVSSAYGDELGLPPQPQAPAPEPAAPAQEQAPPAPVAAAVPAAPPAAEVAAVAAEIEAWRTGRGIEETRSELPLPDHLKAPALAAATAPAAPPVAENGARARRKRR